MPRIPLDGGDGSSRAPDPEMLKKDPMAELFGPGSGLKMVGDKDDEIPDEVRSVLEEYGLSQKSFQCTLKEVPEGATYSESGTPAQTSYIKGWVRSIPSIEWIARNYGPGSYILTFQWRSRVADEETMGSTKNAKLMAHDVPVIISEKFREEYKQYQLSKKIENASNVHEKVRNSLVEKKIESSLMAAIDPNDKPETQSPAAIAKEYITQTLETVKMLGIPMGVQPQPVQKSIEWDKILPVAVTALTALLQMQQESARAAREESNKLLMLLMSSSQQASNQMLELVKTQNGAGAGNNAIKEFKDMIFGAMDIKELLAGQKPETLADKIFRIVEGVAPQILSIAATAASAQAARANPMVGMATSYINNNPDFQALKQNPEEMKAFIIKMDGFFGWKQTDVILQVAGWTRPDDCPRDPSRENPPVIPEDGIEDGVIADA